jgi:hypothetical protein
VNDDSEKLDAAIALLDDPQAKKRRAAAKKLGKFANPKAGKPLLVALQREALDPRTWSSQYAMILAIGFCEYRPALPFLWELAGRTTEHTILYYGIGDAIVRLGRKSEHDLRPVFQTIETRNFPLIYGALQAMAMLRMVPKKSEIPKLIEIAELPEAVKAVAGYPNDPVGLRKWVAAAAAGWPQELVHDFLQRCLGSTDTPLRFAAEQSLKGKYYKWTPY